MCSTVRTTTVDPSARHVRPEDHDPQLLEAAGVRTSLLRDTDDAAAATRLLDRAEAAAGVPLVDEAERHRLEAALAHEQGEHHHAVLARLGDVCVGYAGLVIPTSDEHGVGDVAVAPDVADPQPVLQALLHAVDHVAEGHTAHGTEVWKRQASVDDVSTAIAAGYAVHRRLYVLGRRLDDLPAAGDGSRGDAGTDGQDVQDVRAMTADDVDAVVAVLAAAYEDSAEAGWTRERFEERTGYDWFDLADVRVAEVDGTVRGVHWTKRRSAGTGEVYNLAVHPAAQGARLGQRLLLDGLRHLRDVGCDDVLLWVDLTNEAALRLYVGHGFRARWEDVALRRHTRGVTPHPHPVPSRRG